MPKGTCTVVEDGKPCGEPHFGRGWCKKHYERWRIHGDPSGGGPFPGRDPAERFAEKVNPHGPVPVHRPELGPCSLWTGSLRKGYGAFWDGSRVVRAHRWAWEQEHGPVPDGLELDHLCHNDSGCAGGPDCLHCRCVNVAHLEPVSHKVNMQRGATGMASGAQQRAKTHCPAGHPYDEINTYTKPDGRRQCRTCHRAKDDECKATKRRERERQSRLSTSP